MSGTLRPRASAGPGGRARRVLRRSLERAASPYHDRRVASLEARIRDLEAQVARSRAIHLRVATLSDLVQELLLPVAQRDPKLTIPALRDYRKRSL